MTRTGEYPCLFVLIENLLTTRCLQEGPPSRLAVLPSDGPLSSRPRIRPSRPRPHAALPPRRHQSTFGKTHAARPSQHDATSRNALCAAPANARASTAASGAAVASGGLVDVFGWNRSTRGDRERDAGVQDAAIPAAVRMLRRAHGRRSTGASHSSHVVVQNLRVFVTGLLRIEPLDLLLASRPSPVSPAVLPTRFRIASPDVPDAACHQVRQDVPNFVEGLSRSLREHVCLGSDPRTVLPDRAWRGRRRAQQRHGCAHHHVLLVEPADLPSQTT